MAVDSWKAETGAPWCFEVGAGVIVVVCSASDPVLKLLTRANVELSLFRFSRSPESGETIVLHEHCNQLQFPGVPIP